MRGDPEFAGLAVRRDEHGNLVDQGQLQAQQLRGGGSQLVTSILETLDRGNGSERAFGQLLAIRPPEMREAVVARLDTLRRIEPLIDGLPDTVLFSEDHRLELQQLAAARDPQHLVVHIRRLLHTGLFDWAVNSREAFIAYLMIRALPQGERDRLGQFDFIVGELSTSMRQSLGLHMLDARSASDQLAAVRTRLGDERLWTAEKAPELRSLVALAVSLGDRRWVFEQSRVRRAFAVTELQPMVARFELYDERPPSPRTTYVAERVQESGFWEDYGAFRVLKMIGSAIAIVAGEGFAGRLYVNLPRGEAGARGLPLGAVADALGGDPSGVRVSDTRTVATNEAALNYSWSAGTLDLDIPRLELDSIGMVGSDYSFHTGRVSARGIRAHAEFEREAQPPRAASATLNVAEIDMDDVVAGTTTALNAAAHVHMGGLGIGDSADLEPPAGTGSTHLPVPVLGAVIEIAKIMLRRGLRTEGRSGATQVSFELADFAVEGLSLGGGQQVHSLAIAGVRVTWAGTRVRYLRALIAALQQRPADPRTQTQLADARRELAALEPQERRLQQLVTKARDPHQTLTADEQAELQQLQTSGQGGIVIDTGAITLRGLSGDVSAAELTVDHIRGQGQSDALSSGLFTDDAILRRFAQQGPGLPQPLNAQIELELGTISARDIAIERAIPSTSALQEERNQLLAGRPGLEHQDVLRARVDARLARLHDLIEDRLRLDRLEALTAATPEQVRERRDLHTALARTFGVTIESATLRGTTLSSTATVQPQQGAAAGGLTLGIGELDVRGVRSDAYGADRISGEGLSLEAGAAIPGLGADPTGGAHGRADHLRIEGIRADALGSTVDSIDVRGLAGTVTRLPNGWRITGLHLDTLALSGIDWGTTTKHIRATTPVTISGIDASLDLIGDRIELHRIDIATIAVTAGSQGLIYEDFAAGIRATVFSGGLRGVWAEGLALGADGLERREGATLSGAGIRQFDGVRFAGALGQSLSGTGTLSSPAVQRQDAVGVRLLDDGATRVDLASLLLTEASITTPGGSIRIERVDVSASARITTTEHGYDVQVDGFHIARLVLGNVDWRMADGSTITARGRTELQEITAAVSLSTAGSSLAGATVRSLHINTITATDLTYRQGDIVVHVNRPSAQDHPSLEIHDVDVQGVQWDPRRGVTAGTVTVGSAAAGLEARFGADMTATGTLRAETISVRFAPGGAITARAQSVDTDVEVAAGTTAAGLQLHGLDTGEIQVSGNRITVGAGGAARLRLGPLGTLRLSHLHFANDKLSVDVTGPGIDLSELDAALTLDLNPPGTTPRLARVTIDELNLARLQGAGITVGLGVGESEGAITLTRPASQVRLEGAHVVGLTFDNSASGWTLAGYDTMHLDELALDDLGIQLNLAALASGGGAPGGGFDPRTLVPYRDVMNSVDGEVDIDLVLPGVIHPLGDEPISTFQPVFWVRVAFNHGRVNVSRVEHRALNNVVDEFLDVEQRGRQLVLEFDPQRAASLLGVLGSIAGAYLRTDIIFWDLGTGETLTSASVFTLSQYRFAPGGGGSGPPAVEFDLPHIRAHVLETTHLDLVNDAALTVPAGSYGTITLAPQAMRGLRLFGDVPGPLALNFGLDELIIQAVDLNLSGLGQLTSETLLIQGVGDGRLTFAGFSPATLSTLVTTLRWGNIQFVGTPAPPRGSTAPGGTP